MRSKSKLAAGTGATVVHNVALTHGSALSFGLTTSRGFMHAVAADTRPDGQRRPDEINPLFDGARVSLTLRAVHTFVSPDGRVYGAGATHKTWEALRSAVERAEPRAGAAQEEPPLQMGLGDTNSTAAAKSGFAATTPGICVGNEEIEQGQRLASAFRNENKVYGDAFDWEEVYGGGFNVLTSNDGAAVIGGDASAGVVLVQVPVL
uniref:Uncharacterized protein n=1 Tax=Florenciella parvula TaxID=236787 RepID=A0A7S2BYT5_9STRA|mmetsp:Transcript_22325/g.46449  ORF Transcript_22325/g.46449 Transcript_22325/m.46449 type:complete len:206 (+) Transcript_22325:238-855(+)